LGFAQQGPKGTIMNSSSSFITILSVLLAATLAPAQIIITADDFPTSGYYTRGRAGDSVNFNVGSAGPNQNWTFGDYTWQFVLRTDHLLPSGTPYFISYSTATHAYRTWQPDDLEHASYDYCRVTPDTWYMLGIASAETVIVYNPETHLLPLPIAYGTSGTLVQREHYEIGPDVYDNVDSTISMVDGWGTMQTPYVTAPVLRDFMHSWSISRVNGQTVNSSENVSYLWLNQHAEEVVDVRSENGVTDPNFSTGSLMMWGVPLAAEPPRGPVAQSFSVGQNYPNPFNPATTLPVELERNGKVTLEVYDELGRQVLNEDFDLTMGKHDLPIDGSTWANGTYFARVAAADLKQTVKMQLVK
jgi:hypothetical protein